MKELTKAFNGHNVRVVVKNGVEWFVAKDVCDVLEIKNVSDALGTVQGKHKTTIGLTDSGSNYKTNVLAVDEPGLYRLIFKSRKPEAEKFQEWVYEEVLPSIRKTGKYDVRDIRGKSTENRNLVTAQWQRQGVSMPQEYGGLTREEYRELFGNPGIKKAGMNRSQIIALAAFEAVEALKLDSLPPETLGYRGCKASLKDTAALIDRVRRPALAASGQKTTFGVLSLEKTS